MTQDRCQQSNLTRFNFKAECMIKRPDAITRAFKM